MPDSPFRLDRLRARRVRRRRCRSRTSGELLADHANYPSGVCCHPDERWARLDQGATVASVLMDLDARTMWLADGHAVHRSVSRAGLRDFLAKPSPVALQPADG